MVTSNFSPVKGKSLRVKYPKHGRLNILKLHQGVIEKTGWTPQNGVYATIRSPEGVCRSLSVSKMIEPIQS